MKTGDRREKGIEKGKGRVNDEKDERSCKRIKNRWRIAGQRSDWNGK